MALVALTYSERQHHLREVYAVCALRIEYALVPEQRPDYLYDGRGEHPWRLGSTAWGAVYTSRSGAFDRVDIEAVPVFAST